MHQSSPLFQQYWRECQAGTPAEVILGSPKVEHCKNFGICRVSLEQGRVQGFCNNKTTAYLRIDPPTNRLLVHFLSCSFNDECAERFFQEGVFRMDEDYHLPLNISRALTNSETVASYRIEKGNYPLLVDDHFHTVSLRLARIVFATQVVQLAA